MRVEKANLIARLLGKPDVPIVVEGQVIRSSGKGRRCIGVPDRRAARYQFTDEIVCWISEPDIPASVYSVENGIELLRDGRRGKVLHQAGVRCVIFADVSSRSRQTTSWGGVTARLRDPYMSMRVKSHSQRLRFCRYFGQSSSTSVLVQARECPGKCYAAGDSEQYQTYTCDHSHSHTD